MSGILGYAIEHERREELYSRGQIAYAKWRNDFPEYAWEPAEEMDPEEWFEINDQGRIGSCAAQALTDTAEYCHVIQHGEPIQLSRGFAYLETQKHDGLLGRDAGSTLDGGTKVLKEGLPLESEFPYVDDYRALYNKYRSVSGRIGRAYQLKGEIPMPTSEDAYRFLSSWQGIIQIGIMWTIPDAGYEITSYQYSSRAGGHSVGIVGYVKMPSWPLGIGLKLKNSWSKRWGRNGYKLLHPKAYDQMFRHQWNVAVGRSDMPRPTPRVDAIDHARHHGIAT